MRVLIIEDNERLASLISKGLAAASILSDHAGTEAEAKELLATATPDAVILDLGLPDGDGIALLQGLRRQGSSLPVLILTARVQVSDRVEGLDAGADDYLTKPFAMEELVARIRALLRRPQTHLGNVLQAGNIELDVQSREVQVAGQVTSLSRRETDLLESLLRRTGKVVQKGYLEETLYGPMGDLSSNSVEVLTHRLRAKLSRANANVEIHTIRGHGYMLTSGDAAA